MLRIVTDGAADMPIEWEKKYRIHVLPLHVNFGEESYTQGQGFTRDDFYRLVQEKRMIPKTSLPSVGAIQTFYRSIAQKGDSILSIHISSKLSGTFSTVEMAACDLQNDFQIIPFDSLAGSAAQSFLACEARKLDQAGLELTAIISRLEVIRKNISILFTLDTLEYAYLSGRINALQNLLSAAFQVKPIIVLRDGLLDIADKVRTRTRALDRVIDKLQEKLGSRRINAAVVHAADYPAAQKMLRQVTDRLNVQEAILTDLSIPVAAHLGKGAIGVVAYPIEEEVLR